VGNGVGLPCSLEQAVKSREHSGGVYFLFCVADRFWPISRHNCSLMRSKAGDLPIGGFLNVESSVCVNFVIGIFGPG
jgi:hypothetical protein